MVTPSSRAPVPTTATAHASQLYQTSICYLLCQAAELQTQHHASPMTTQVSHVPTAMVGVCQDHPHRSRHPRLLSQQFMTSTFTQRLQPASLSSQQHTLSSMRPLQPSILQGFPLPLKPNLPGSLNPFFLNETKGEHLEMQQL